MLLPINTAMSNPNAATAVAAAAANGAADRLLSKLAAFWSTSLAVWFLVVEGQFALNQVTDRLAMYYLVSKANVDVIRKIMEDEPTEDSY
jgi:hypothetical protein